MLETHNDVQRVVDQLRSDFDHLAQETKHLKNGERFSKLRKMNDLRQIINSLEDIDHSLDSLLQEQSGKTSVH
ncbi:MAG: hypothetical protein WA960_13485 [Tunicatimonas sp.]